jgi:Glycosyl hydrolases family 39
MNHRDVPLFIVLCCVSLAAAVARPAAAPKASPIRLQPTGNAIPKLFFGMHIHYLATTTPWPGISLGSWRLWDAFAAWPNLEPQKGKWEFAVLDKYVANAEQHHVDIFLPLGLSPGWASSRPGEKSGYEPGNAAPPADLDDWQTYVRTVATRYRGRIHNYEIWNEPNLKQFYTGSTEGLVQLACAAYQTLKQVDSSVIVSSPPFTGASGLNMFDQYLKAGGGECADVIGYHLYVNPGPPEEIVLLIQQVERTMRNDGAGNKPLWDTETGWAVQNKEGTVKAAPGKGFNSFVLSPEQASAYLARTYILSWASSVSRLYWYAWDNGVMGLTEKDGKTLKAPARAYAELENWLIGARMISCASDSNGTWASEITRDDGYHGWILWNPDRYLQFPIPGDWRIQNVRDLQGGTQKLNKDSIVQIGPTPILLENTIR